MKEIIASIVSSLKSSTAKKSSKIIFSDPAFSSVEFSKSYFKEIADSKSGRKIAFVDGGNAPVIESPGFSLHFVRVFCVVYQNSKRLKTLKHEFFVLVDLVKDAKLSFSSKIFPLDKTIVLNAKELEFDFFDKNLAESDSVKPSSAANIARRFCEISLAKRSAKELGEKDVIVLDGSLQAKATHEQALVDSLFREADSKKITVAGLSKTMSFVTDAGDSAGAALSAMTELGKWQYLPAAKSNSLFEIGIAKLNRLSKYVFRVDVFPKTADFGELFSLLAENSKDPVFPGYPYGLIDADRQARVSNNECQYLKTVFSSKIDLSKYESATNAHDILDRIG
jgi:hypothetical protein